jgi:flagellar biosynthesis anti-sigma factor FlgM
MKITGTDNEIAKHIGDTARTRTKEPADKPRTPADVPTESTEDAIVHLSQRARDVQRAIEAMQSEPDVRSEKVQAIKKQIKNGTYKIDYDKTAEEMLKAFSDEIS